MTLPDDLKVRLAALEGLISERTGLRLADLAAQVPVTHAIVEVGSFKGKSTCYLGAGSRAGAGAQVFAVDPWDLDGNIYGKHGFTDPTVRKLFADQIAGCGLEAQITPIRGFSVDVASKWTGRIGLLYIDGDHEYTSVRNDFTAWRPHFDAATTVVFDDYATRNKGVTRYVDELAKTSFWTVDTTTLPLAIVNART